MAAVQLGASARRRAPSFRGSSSSIAGCAFSTNVYSSSSNVAALLHRQIVQEAVGAGVDDQDLLLDRQRRILARFRISTRRLPRFSCAVRRLVEIRAELRERRQRAILRQIQTQAAGHLTASL